jgi:hypothetical protein
MVDGGFVEHKWRRQEQRQQRLFDRHRRAFDRGSQASTQDSGPAQACRQALDREQGENSIDGAQDQRCDSGCRQASRGQEVRDHGPALDGAQAGSEAPH